MHSDGPETPALDADVRAPAWPSAASQDQPWGARALPRYRSRGALPGRSLVGCEAPRMNARVCSRCGESKDLDEFNRDKSDPAGRQRTCRSCAKMRWREATSGVWRDLPHKELLAEFWKHVNVTPKCWIWTGKLMQEDGYGTFFIFGRRFRAHRFSYEYHSGEDASPDLFIDHRCFNTKCVNPDHLRLATPSQNGQNLSSAHRDSKSGVRGVTWVPSSRKWKVYAAVNGKQSHGGYFTDLDDAKRAVVELRKRLMTHNEFDRQGIPQ